MDFRSHMQVFSGTHIHDKALFKIGSLTIEHVEGQQPQGFEPYFKADSRLTLT